MGFRVLSCCLASSDERVLHLARQCGRGILPRCCGWKPQPRPVFLGWCFILLTALLTVDAASFAAESPEQAKAVAALRLANGDYVAGEFRDSTGPDLLRWQGAAFATPFDFDLCAVSSIHFPAPGDRPKPAGDYCFELAGGDVLFGSLAGFSSENAVLDVPRFGLVHVRRASIRRMIRWRDGADLVYLGPNGLDDWNASSPAGQWTEEAGHLVTDREGSSITGKFDIPVRASIEFEISWTAGPDFVVALADSSLSHLQAFRFEVWDHNLVFYRETDTEADLAWLGDIRSGAGRARFQMYLDHERGRALVYSASGEPLADMTVGGGQSSSRPRFMLANGRGNVRLERLRIRRWDGESPREVQANRSRIHLSDGSIVYGEVIGFDASAKQFVVTANDGSTRLPAGQVGSIVLSPSDGRQPRTIRVAFRDGVRLSGELAKVEGDWLSLTCPDIAEPLRVAVSELHTLMVLANGEPSPSTNARVGRLEADGLKLTGFLEDGRREPGASCLVWHPHGSATASAIRDDASAKIVYRDPLPQNPQPQGAVPVAPVRVRGGGGILGQLALALAGASTQPVPLRQTSRFGPSLYLRTGDTIPCEVDRIDERGVAFRSSVFDATFVPHDKIKAVELENRSQGIKINRSKRDRLLTLPRMQKNNPPTHLIRSTAGDYLRARLNGMDDRTLTAEVRLETRQLPREQISQIIWLHDEDADSPEEAKVSSESATATRVQALRDDGIRLTFFPEALANSTLSGTSDVLGTCRVALADVDQLLIGGAIEQAATDLAYQRWRLSPAVEPKYVDRTSGSAVRTPGTESALVGKPAPDFKLDLISGEAFRLSDHRNRVIVLDFWATWCGPCIQTMPQVDRVVGAFQEQGVMLVAVNLQDTPDAITATMERLELKSAVALDRDGVAAEKYSVTAIPQTVIIDAQGNVARLFVGGGPQLADQLKDALESMVTKAD